MCIRDRCYSEGLVNDLISVSTHLNNFHFLAFSVISQNFKKAGRLSYWTDLAEFFFSEVYWPIGSPKKFFLFLAQNFQKSGHPNLHGYGIWYLSTLIKVSKYLAIYFCCHVLKFGWKLYTMLNIKCLARINLNEIH